MKPEFISYVKNKDYAKFSSVAKEKLKEKLIAKLEERGYFDRIKRIKGM